MLFLLERGNGIFSSKATTENLRETKVCFLFSREREFGKISKALREKRVSAKKRLRRKENGNVNVERVERATREAAGFNPRENK